MHIAIAIDPGTYRQGLAYRLNDQPKIHYVSIELKGFDRGTVEALKAALLLTTAGKKLLDLLPGANRVYCAIERPDRHIRLKLLKVGQPTKHDKQIKAVSNHWRQLIAALHPNPEFVAIDSLKWQRCLLGKQWSGKAAAKRLSMEYARENLNGAASRLTPDSADAICLLLFSESQRGTAS